MCLITLADKKVQIATEDITVYKYLDISEDDYIVGKAYIKSPYNDFTWEMNTLYETELVILPFIDTDSDNNILYGDKIAADYYEAFMNREPNNKLIVVTEGFHSYFTLERAKSKSCIFEAVIPAGSEYLLDETGLVVSNKVKIIKEL